MRWCLDIHRTGFGGVVCGFAAGREDREDRREVTWGLI
jgi:hypothetical protein